MLKFALAPHDNGKRRRRYARLRVHRALKESWPRVFFCRPPRFNWMSLLRCRALLSVPGPCSSVYPRSFSRVRSGVALSSSALPSLLSHRASRVRSPADLRSYIYCIEETRAAAFLAHAPLVMSGLQSPVCLSVRLSRGPVDRSPAFHAPYSSLLERSPFVSLFLRRHCGFCPLSSFAWFPLFDLVTVDVGPYPDTHEDQVALFSRKLISHFA